METTVTNEAVRGISIDQVGLARTTMDDTAMRANGFNAKPTHFAMGTMVIDAGVNNFRQSRAEFENQVLLGDG